MRPSLRPDCHHSALFTFLSRLIWLKDDLHQLDRPHQTSLAPKHMTLAHCETHHRILTEISGDVALYTDSQGRDYIRPTFKQANSSIHPDCHHHLYDFVVIIVWKD